MDSMYTRTQMLIKEEGIEKLKASKVLVIGLGGVGGYVVEALARAGVGHIGLVDNDTLKESNLNRQILATTSTIGMHKTDAAKDRILSINPNCKIDTYACTYPSSEIDISMYDYIADAIDTITSKIALVKEADEKGVKIISSLSTGNRIEGTYYVKDIYKTENCPMAKVMRKKLKEIGIKKLKVVWSPDGAMEGSETLEEGGRHIPGSISYIPGIAGLTIAGEIIRDLLKD